MVLIRPACRSIYITCRNALQLVPNCCRIQIRSSASMAAVLDVAPGRHSCKQLAAGTDTQLNALSRYDADFAALDIVSGYSCLQNTSAALVGCTAAQGSESLRFLSSRYERNKLSFNFGCE